MKLKELLDCENSKIPHSLLSRDINVIERNEDSANEETLFFYLKKKNENSERIKSIISKKPLAIVTEDKEIFKGTKIPVIEVKNARESYSIAYSNFCKIDYENLKFIGITGTNGKTTTATMLKAILENNGKKCGFIGTGKILSKNRLLSDKDYSMTSPDPEVLYPVIKEMERDECEFIIMEVSSHALALDKTSPIPFDVGIFTGLSSEHMDFHNNMDNYFLAKEKLISKAKCGIINIDDEKGLELYKKYREKSVGVSIKSVADVTAIDIKAEDFFGSRYIYKTNKFLTPISLNIPGIYNIYNSMLAVSAAIHLGTLPCKCKEGLKELSTIEGRFEKIVDSITVIIDYAHTPFALENLLKTVNHGKNTEQKIILVFGCGGERDKEKRPIMASVAEKYCDKIIVTQDNSRNESLFEIIRDITAGFKTQKYGIISNRAVAIRHAVESANDSDIVIIAGKGHERYILDTGGYKVFDEKAIITDALSKRRRLKKNYENKA